MDEKINNLRHSAAHLLAAAVQELYPEVLRTIGPAIESGFYYDFDFSHCSKQISEVDLPEIEKVMGKLLKDWKGFNRREVSAADAKESYKDNPYKIELIEQFSGEGQTLTFYDSVNYKGEVFYSDLCRGGHSEQPKKEIGAFKLLSLAGAYWRGDEKNKMLTRIYGTAFTTKEELVVHLKMLEEIKRRDHRKIGQDLDLFTFSDQVGPGLPLWTPKGTIIKDELENWAKDTEKKWGYVRVSTPHIAKHTLFETSGHLPYYKEDMYSPMLIDEEEYYLKGMNCPHHHMIYKSRQHSYRELPLRYAEYGMVYRYEMSGTLYGLMRVRAMDQNDAHIYTTLDQAEEEFLEVIKLHEYYYNTIGLTKDDYYIVLALPDEKKRDKYHGDKSMWDEAERMTRGAVERSGIKYIEDIGGAAFYGPKTDFNIHSAGGRDFSISTCQLDLYMPTRFNLTFNDKDGQEKLVAVIHRAPLGSHERFIGFLIEHYAGAFPIWLSPIQVEVIPISDKHVEYANGIKQTLLEIDVRVEVDDRAETMQSKIRDAQLQKIPYMIVVGDREMEEKQISVRSRSGENRNAVSLGEFIKELKQEITEKK